MDKKRLKREIKSESIVNMLEKCDELKIKYELIYQLGKQYYFKLSKGKKFYYVWNSLLQRNLDYLSASLVDNKDLTKQILSTKKIKAPQGFIAHDLAEIKRKMKSEKLNFPIVLKPGAMALGKGVYANLNTHSAVKKSLNAIRGLKHPKKNHPLVVEEYFDGRDFRVLVLKGKFIACAERVHPQVKADGKNTLQQLIKKQLKTQGHGKMILDWEVQRCLERQKIKLTDIPEKDQLIRLRENANISTGGICVNRTQEVCAKFKKIAEVCAREFKLQLAGIDIMTKDITNPRADYRVIEINCVPDYFLHDDPDIGASEDVTTKIIKELF